MKALLRSISINNFRVDIVNIRTVRGQELRHDAISCDYSAFLDP